MFTISDYLFSIAYMKTSTSKLLEAQAKIIRKFAEGEFPITQIIDKNERIKDQIEILENLHRLLLDKFELIINSLEMREEIESKFENLNDLQQEEQFKLLNIDEPMALIFKGRGQGAIINRKDSFCNGLAIFQTYVSDTNHEDKERFLSYSVMKGTKMLVLLADPEKMITKFTLDSEYQTIRIEGTGTIIIRERSKADISQTGKYLFNVRTKNGRDGFCAQMFFEIDVASNTNELSLHKSGLIESQSKSVVIEPVIKCSQI